MKSQIGIKSINRVALAVAIGWMVTGAAAASPVSQLVSDCKAAARVQYGNGDEHARVRLLDIRGSQWAEGKAAKLVVFPPEGKRFTAECTREGDSLVLSQPPAAVVTDHVAVEQAAR